MVKEYLEKRQSELLFEKFTLEKKLKDLQARLKENEELTHLLEKADDTIYASFSPRSVNQKNKSKIDSLYQEKKSMEETLSLLQENYKVCEANLRELKEALHSIYSFEAEYNENVTDDKQTDGLEVLQYVENEITRFAAQLDNTIIHGLHNLFHKTELCENLVEIDPMRCKMELMSLKKSINAILNDTEKTISAISPVALPEQFGLDKEIENMLSKLEDEENKNISFHIEGDVYRIKPGTAISIYRLIKELYIELMQYTDFTFVEIILHYDINEINLTIKGNAKHRIDHINEILSKQKLSLISEMLHLLYGKIILDTNEKFDTMMIISIPVKNEVIEIC